MKKVIRILLPIVLVIAIIACLAWYLFIYDREFTRDVLLTGARYFEAQGHHAVATWFYNTAYNQSEDRDGVAIELAQQYKSSGNYTKAEYTLTNAISDGGGVDVYIALCKTFVEQDKLYDAVNMLDSVTNPDIKAQLDAMRPAAPTTLLPEGLYNEFLAVELQTDAAALYVTADGSYPSTADSLYTQPVTLTAGVNSLQAIAVAESGLVSPLVKFSYTVGGIIEEVTFADASMEAEIRALLGVADETTLYTNDLWSITSFTVPADAADYSDLKLLPYLEELNISGGVSDQLSNITSLTSLKTLAITDTPVSEDVVEAIAAFPMLTKLTLNGCGLSSVTELEAARNLVQLDLSNNTIRNISSLSLMQDLEVLKLSNNALTDLASLSVLRKLTKLDVSYNTIASLAPISGATTLTELNAQHNQLTEVAGLENLTALTYLSLANNTITEISPIAACKNLYELHLSNNTITDISSLSALEKLMYFYFSFNQVTELPQWSKDCSLVTIDGSNNLLTSLAPLSGLEALNNVYMDYNAGITTADPLAKCPVMIHVNIYGTSVKDVTALTSQSIIVNYDPTIGE